jgi:hypothetical protein
LDVWRAVADLLEVAFISRRIDAARRRLGPLHLVERLRRRGAAHPRRGERNRARLKQVIRIVDRAFFAEPNCYRRALIEMAMDAGAATEVLHMGLNSDRDLGLGHAWLDSSPDKGEGYQAEFSI